MGEQEEDMKKKIKESLTEEKKTKKVKTISIKESLPKKSKEPVAEEKLLVPAEKPRASGEEYTHYSFSSEGVTVNVRISQKEQELGPL